MASPEYYLEQKTFVNATPHLFCKPWELVETTLPQGENIPVSETLFSLGNGHIHVRGYNEETDGAVMSYGHSTHGCVVAATRRSKSKVDHTKALVIEKPSVANPMRGTYVDGMYEQRLLTRGHRAFTVGTCARVCFGIPVPDAFCIDVFVGSEHVSVTTGTIVSHSRVLDLRTGELRRRIVWQSPTQGREVTIESSRFVSSTRKSVAALKYTVTAKNVSNTDICIVSRTIVHPDAEENLKVENVVTRNTLVDACSAVCVRTCNSCRRLVVATTETCCSTVVDAKTLLGSFAGVGSPTFANTAQQELLTTCPSRSNIGGSNVASSTLQQTSQQQQQQQTPHQQPQQQQMPQQLQAITFLAPKSSETSNGADTIYTSVISDCTRIVLTKYIAFLSDEDAAPEDICDLAIQQARDAADVSYDVMFQEQKNTMAKLWEVADIRVKISSTGNPSLQGALRFNILQLFMSTGWASLRGSPPRGVMSLLYSGLHQWDIDAIVIPYFSHVNPETALYLLQFRIDTLPQAKNLAADMDLPRGALYPLRTISGGENSPLPFSAAFLYGNALIAYAMKHYVTATNDTSVLLRGGADVIFSTVLIWLIWGTFDKGRFHICFVGGPDEYTGLSDNNFFTNIMAQNHMQWAVRLAAFFREKHPTEWELLKERCQFTDEDISMIERAAAKMVILFDAKNRVHPVDQSFMRKKKWELGELKRKNVALICTFHPSVIYRHQVCQMPDVLLASVLLPERFTKDESRANYNFYEPITTNDSSLSPMIFSVVASHLDMPGKAMFYFNRVLFFDIGNLTGSTVRGLHINTSAGCWWCLAVGFGGMRVLQGVLHFNPILPDQWEEYEFLVRHRGCLIKVLVTWRTVIYTMIEDTGDKSELLLIHSDTNRIYLVKDVPESVRLYRDVHVFDFDCVVFDMDSVIQDIEAYHYEAWKQTLEDFMRQLGQPNFILTSELYLAYLKHYKPFASLQRFFDKQGITSVTLGCANDTMEQNTLHGLFKRKLHHFRQFVASKELEPRAGSLELITELRQNGIIVGCVTVSKNGHWLLNESSQINSMLDGCLDGNDGENMGLRWRPEMDYFSAMCNKLNVLESRTIIIMDGIDGFSKSALEQFKMIVDVQKVPENVDLSIPCVTISNLKDISLSLLEEAARDFASQRRSKAHCGDKNMYPA